MKKIERPWGKMWVLFHTKNIWIKIIKVWGRTSLQTHANRTEYHFKIDWIWGYLKVLPWQKHRMTKGLYVEIAVGMPEENDIVRYEDDYGR